MGTPFYDDHTGLTAPEGAGRGRSVAEVAASCAWCGTPVWTGSTFVEFEVGDPETGEPVVLAVCSPEHRIALREHRVSSRRPAGN